MYLDILLITTAQDLPLMRRHSGTFWPIVGPLAAAQLIGWGSLYFSFTLFVVPISTDLDLGRGRVATAFSVGLVAWACAALPMGYWLDRRGSRTPMVCGSVAAALLLIACAHVQRYESFLAIWLGLGVAMAMVLSQPAYATVRQTFDVGSVKSAITTLSLATGLAATAFIPSTQALIGRFGWRHALLVLACLNMLCAVAYALSVPPPSRRMEFFPARTKARQEQGPLRRAALDVRFWALLLAAIGKAAISTSLAVHLLPLLVERGFSSAAALAVLALAGPVTIGTRIVLLWSAHQWAGTGRVLGIGATLAQLVAQIALVAVGPFCVGLLVIFTVFNGVAEGLFTIALPLVTVEIWGDDGYATIQGAIQTPSMLARAASPALIAVIWTSMGSYGLAAPVLAVVSVISAAAYLAAAMPRDLRS
jgi:predicted MFS family arabinose efflux permease